MTWRRLFKGFGVLAPFALVGGIALVAVPNGLGLLIATAVGFAGGRTVRPIWRDPRAATERN